MWSEVFNPLLEDKWRYIILHGGRGGAKSWHTAIAKLQRARRKRKRGLCLREHQKSIRESVHKLLKDRIHEYGFNDFKVNEHNIINTVTGSEEFFLGLWRNSHSIKSYEGIDEGWVEEAQAVSMESLDYLLPTIRKTGSRIVFTMNRFAEDDPVWERLCKNPSPDTCIIKINMMDLPKAFQSDVLMKEMERDKIEDFDRYLHIWEGEPLGQDPQSILSRTDINKAMDRTIEPVGGESAGADIARFGDDRIVFYKGKGFKTYPPAVYRKLGIPETSRKLMDFVNYNKQMPIKIDDTGLGGGVTDILKENGYNVFPVNFGATGETIKQQDKYANVITEMWFDFKDNVGEHDIPNDPELKAELTNRQFVYTPDERKIVEPKKDYKKRHALSPDKADGFLLRCYQPKVKDAYFGVIDHDWIGGGM